MSMRGAWRVLHVERGRPRPRAAHPRVRGEGTKNERHPWGRSACALSETNKGPSLHEIDDACDPARRAHRGTQEVHTVLRANTVVTDPVPHRLVLTCGL